MKISVFSDPHCVEHDTGDHPEKPERWRAVDAALRSLQDLPGPALDFVCPQAASDADLLRVHSQAHLQHIAAFCAAGGGRIDEDTLATAATEQVARRSAGAAIAAVKNALEARHAGHVALCRPPGHHALVESTMGFCFYNNAALAARWAQAEGGVGRVAILDWDLHHGNGTEAIFWQDPSVLFMSLHQSPSWPGTGAATDIGEGPGTGYNVNVALPEGVGDTGYGVIFDRLFSPLMASFKPEILIVSAGFDAHWRDPLGKMGLSVAGFAGLTARALQWANEYCDGRGVFLMEGGYDIEALAASWAATVQVLRGQPFRDPLGRGPAAENAPDVESALLATRCALLPYWDNLSRVGKG
ncbi:MAG: histone deacetylase [Candidatus Sericytochromatia bacterium]|nr:histone deacetylase [Candidatus Sericytochromatia bacterium]